MAQTADEHYKQFLKYSDEKKVEKALESIQNAVRLDSNNARYYQMLAITLQEMDRRADAYAVYMKAIVKFPEDSDLMHGRGLLMFTLGEFDLAIADYNSALKICKTDTGRFYLISNRASAKIYKRDFQGGYEDLMICYKIDSNNMAVLTNLGAVCDEIGKDDEVMKYLLRAIQLSPKDVGGYANIGFRYQKLGDHRQAIQYYNKVLELSPEEPLGFSNRSYSKLKLGDIKGAMEDIEKAIELYPGNSYAYRNRALIYIEVKDYKKACEDLNAAVRKGFTVSYGDEVINLIQQHCKTTN